MAVDWLDWVIWQIGHEESSGLTLDWGGLVMDLGNGGGLAGLGIFGERHSPPGVK
jgi:hypothetical protein